MYFHPPKATLRDPPSEGHYTRVYPTGLLLPLSMYFHSPKSDFERPTQRWSLYRGLSDGAVAKNDKALAIVNQIGGSSRDLVSIKEAFYGSMEDPSGNN